MESNLSGYQNHKMLNDKLKRLILGMMKYFRQHLEIENKLHWSLVVTFNEEKTE